MPFKSKAEMAKWQELVRQGKITPEQYKDRLTRTESLHKLPERITVKRAPRVKKI